jgi:hypothetical protein
MHATLENRRKATTKSPRSALKRKNKVEESGALGSRIKKDHRSTSSEDDDGESGTIHNANIGAGK